MAPSGLNMSRRIRRTPYTQNVEACGVTGFSVVNHMLLPKAFQHSLEEDYWHLREHVQIWDVSCQRQVELKGPDAKRLAQWMTPRNLSDMKAGQCRYVPIVDENGGMINDPVLLKLAEDHYWFSIADSDLLLWAKGLAAGTGMRVEVKEPDVSPLAIQGPRAENLLAELFGPQVRTIGFFKFDWIELAGTPQLIARSGYSKQGGFEIYLQGSHLGPTLWEAIWETGQAHNIRPGCPNLIERIEAGLLSLGNEFTLENNPFECGFESLCDLESDIDFLAKPKLRQLARAGIDQQIRGIVFGEEPGPVCGSPWPLFTLGTHRKIGQITSAAFSPRLKTNVGLSMVQRAHWAQGEPVQVALPDGRKMEGRVANLPLA